MRILLFTVFTFLIIAPSQAQTKVGDVTLPNTMMVGDSNLELNGAGIREKMWFDLYSGGLYLTEKASDANNIVNADRPMAIKLHITSKLITSDKMISAINDGFDASTNGNTSAIAADIKKFTGFFSAEIVKNNVFDITYQPGVGVVAFKDGKELGTIKGMEFKKALFGIWLGNKPGDDDLKDNMLGL
jgi:hypothetical protein